VSRHRFAAAVVAGHGAGPAGPPLLDDTEQARLFELGQVVAPERADLVWVLELVERLDRATPARDRAAYERGRVDERLYWRVREEMARAGLGDRLAPVPRLVVGGALVVLGGLVLALAAWVA